MMFAVIGPRLSPYLYFWQSSQTVEQERVIGRSKAASDAELRTTAWDVNTGMFFSNLIMYFVILCTAATLFRTGQTTVLTAAQAAQALRPLAGKAASLLFAVGIIGVGVFACPAPTTGPPPSLPVHFDRRFGCKNGPHGA